jgi:hypothetical protein
MANDEAYSAVLYIYRVEDKHDFWFFDGRLYWRFARVNGEYRLVRSQAYLPAGCLGYCVGVTAGEQRSLSRVAARSGLRLKFYTDLQECERQATAGRHGQYIFDARPPAGVISGDRIFFTRE